MKIVLPDECSWGKIERVVLKLGPLISINNSMFSHLKQQMVSARHYNSDRCDLFQYRGSSVCEKLQSFVCNFASFLDPRFRSSMILYLTQRMSRTKEYSSGCFDNDMTLLVSTNSGFWLMPCRSKSGYESVVQFCQLPRLTLRALSLF